MTYSAADISEMEAEKQREFAGFLLLQIALLGYNPAELLAQWIAGLMISSGEQDVTDFSMLISTTCARVVELLDTTGQIWPGLIPGPPTPFTRWEVVEVKPDEPEVTYRTCITVAQRVDRYNNTWLLWDVDESVWYASEAETFNNVSHPDFDELREGMTIEISDQLLTPRTPEEVADFLDPSNPG